VAAVLTPAFRRARDATRSAVAAMPVTLEIPIAVRREQNAFDLVDEVESGSGKPDPPAYPAIWG
jgi:hypothetical protein